ncbi:MAG: hypothetical protein ACI9CF_001418 [Candidatus Omnitrophota bacterium]|jgi:hypothetical protein
MTIKVPITYEAWEKVGLPIDGGSLMTSLSLIQAEVFELIERKQPVFLVELLDELSWPEPLSLMSIGGLIREKLIIAERSENKIELRRNNENKSDS